MSEQLRIELGYSRGNRMKASNDQIIQTLKDNLGDAVGFLEQDFPRRVLGVSDATVVFQDQYVCFVVEFSAVSETELRDHLALRWSVMSGSDTNFVRVGRMLSPESWSPWFEIGSV
jgi:hypothetical protein